MSQAEIGPIQLPTPTKAPSIDLDRVLGKVRRQLWRERWWWLWTGITLALAFMGLALLGDVSEGRMPREPVLGSLLILSGLGAVIAVIATRTGLHNPHDIANRLEKRFPALNQRLLTAMDHEKAGSSNSFFVRQLHREIAHHHSSEPWSGISPRWLARMGTASGLVSTLFLCGVGYAVMRTPVRSLGLARLSEAVTAIEIDPGDVSLPRGGHLVITARLPDAWPRDEKIDVTLQCQSQQGAMDQRPMTQNLDDPIYGIALSNIQQSFRYSVLAGNGTSETYSVDVFEFPELVQADVELDFPQYTGMEDRRVEDTQRVSVVTGTDLTWTLRLNKPVAEATLQTSDGNTIPLSLQSDRAILETRVAESMDATLRLVDSDGRTNTASPRFRIRMLENNPPKIELRPASDLTVSPLEEFQVAATVTDDFGIARSGLTYRFSGGEPVEVGLGPVQTTSATAGAKKQPLQHDFSMESLEARADQLLSYYIWTEDVGPDGQPRRTQSDLVFAEVRPLEEIYREGQPPPGGQGQSQSQSGQQAEQLAELQKQIISATWRLVRNSENRRSDPESNDDPMGADVQVVLGSQQQAAAQLEELLGELEDETSLAHAQEAGQAMQSAIKALTSAVVASTQRPASLGEAIRFEEAAYSGLLRLRAREFQVTRSQNQRSSQGSASAQRRQKRLQNLELEQDESRYETQQQAQEATPEDPVEQQQRQILNRLRELAQRQEDLNEEIAAVQSALETAEDEEEKEEIRRQLKRLREQQRDIMRELDETQERVQEAQQQEQQSSQSTSSQDPSSSQSQSQGQARQERGEQLQEALEQLQDSRRNAQESADALEENDASRALTSGRRTQESLEELRNELQRQTAEGYRQAVESLAEQAEQLLRDEQAIGERLAEMDQPGDTAGLRGDGRRDELQQQLQDQAETLESLQESLRETVEEAEEAQPLLADKLYEAHGDSMRSETTERLRQASQWLQRGFDAQAGQLESTARENMKALNAQLQQARQLVVDDDTESLNRALTQLDRLNESLRREIAENRPSDTQGESTSPSEPPGQQSDRSDSGQRTPDQEEADQQAAGQPSRDQQPNTPSQDSPSAEPSGASPQSNSQQSGRGQASSQQEPQSNPDPGRNNGPLGQTSSSPGQTNSSPGQTNSSPGQTNSSPGLRGGERQASPSAAQVPTGPQDSGGPVSPLTGDGFLDWSDGMRDIAELVGDPELRADAERIRGRAREARIEYKRHSKEPQWDLMEEMLVEPLDELKKRVTAELLRRSARKDVPVAIDRDPVPEAFRSAVSQYYERIGGGQ